MPIYITIFFLEFAALIASFVLFDLLVRREYAEHKRDWLSDGSPHGFFFVPLEARSLGGLSVKFGSGIAYHRCWFKWVFSTPVWLREDARARRLHRGFRISVVGFNLGWIAFFIGLVLVQ